MVRQMPDSPSSRLHRRKWHRSGNCRTVIHGLEGHATVSPIGSWEVVSSYSSATAPDSHGISCADPRSEPTDRFSKLTKNYLALQNSAVGWLIAACTRLLKTYLSNGSTLSRCAIASFFFSFSDY